MNRRIVLIPLLGLLAILAGAGPTAAQGPGGKAKWEYATLTFDEPVTGNATALWEAGKQILGAQSDKFHNEALAKVYKDLGGKEEHITLGQLLDHVGQAGWEMVSHTRVIERGWKSRTWVFKRPAQ